jgi:hypothetical protein
MDSHTAGAILVTGILLGVVLAMSVIYQARQGTLQVRQQGLALTTGLVVLVVLAGIYGTQSTVLFLAPSVLLVGGGVWITTRPATPSWVRLGGFFAIASGLLAMAIGLWRAFA